MRDVSALIDKRTMLITYAFPLQITQGSSLAPQFAQYLVPACKACKRPRIYRGEKPAMRKVEP